MRLRAGAVAIVLLAADLSSAEVMTCGPHDDLPPCGGGHGAATIVLPPGVHPDHHWLNAAPGGAKLAPETQTSEAGVDRAGASKAGVEASGGGGHHGGRYH